MTISSYIPPLIFESLFSLARKHHLAVKEVEWILVREALKALVGFKCNHERVGASPTTGLPFCKECYSRLDQVKGPIYEGKKVVEAGTYRELPTFIRPQKEPEPIKVDQRKKKLSGIEQIAEALKAADQGLQPDQRGGE